MIGELFKTVFAQKQGTVTINGTTYTGNSVSINDNGIVIDGNIVSNLSSLGINISVRIDGNCDSVNTTSGDISINGEVTGNVSTVSGDVKCNNISGSVRTVSGDIVCMGN
jgi:hypothetical protein